MKIVITVKDTDNVIGLKEDIAMRLEGVADIVRIDTADVVPKSEVARLEQDVTRLVQENEDLKDSNEHLAVMLEETKIELEVMRGAANSYKMHYENLARKIFMDIDRVVEKYSMGDIEYPAFLNIIAEFKKKYTEG